MICDMMLSFISMPGPTELIVIGLVGLLIFGNRLPDVGRSLGRGIVEFKRGIRGIDEELDNASSKKERDDTVD